MELLLLDIRSLKIKRTYSKYPEYWYDKTYYSSIADRYNHYYYPEYTQFLLGRTMENSRVHESFWSLPSVVKRPACFASAVKRPACFASVKGLYLESIKFCSLFSSECCGTTRLQSKCKCRDHKQKKIMYNLCCEILEKKGLFDLRFKVFDYLN
jgi:hypothetical protein